ncbi:MAG: hypothetical protein P8X90_35090 [Desulfobacterales bacterium]
MIYAIIILGAVLLALLVINWLRKVQYDAVHRNFLDFEDHYGGKVVRGGFAVRPRFSGSYRDARFSISISSEKRKQNGQREFYISIYFQAAARSNYTVMANAWLENRELSEKRKNASIPILDNTYILEVSNKKNLRKLKIRDIEDHIRRIHPFAYILISRKGLIMERLSTNLIQDTEFDTLNPYIDELYNLSQIPEEVTAENSGP